MKVLVVSHTYIVPINRVKWQVLAQRHPDISLTILFPKLWPGALFKHKSEDVVQTDKYNCTFVALDVFNAGNEMVYWYKPLALWRLLRACKPDVVHVEQGDNALSYTQILLFCWLQGIACSAVFFTWINWIAPRSLKYMCLWRWVERYNLSHSSGAIVGNGQARDILVDKGFKKPVTVLPQLGIDQHLFSPAQRTNQSLTARKRIGYIGRFVPEKGMFLLLNAFEALANCYDDWDLEYVGKGPSVVLLRQLIVQKNLTHRVFIRDAVPHQDIAQVMKTFDVFVLPSYDTPLWKEQFGHVLIEAMACQVPVIGSNAGAIADVIGDAGMICKQHDQQDLQRCLEHLMTSPEIRDVLGRAGRERVEHFFSHESIADRTYEFWRNIRQ